MTNYYAALVDELYQLGIREVVISPGSRSTPLALLFCEHQFQTYVNIDERSAGFFALGIARDRQRPVVLLCTSGSAVANYFPSIVEAKFSKVPLIILTADRPPELRMVGAPQTIDQNKIFHQYTNFYEELALPDNSLSMCRYVRVVMQKAYAFSFVHTFGVSHINIPIREPLLPDLANMDFKIGRQRQPLLIQTGEQTSTFDSSCLFNKKGILICGFDSYSDYHEDVIALAQKLKAPLLADPLSNLRNYESEFIIDSYDAFLKSNTLQHSLAPEFIIHFGLLPVSKRLQQFISLHEDALYIQVGKSFEYSNPMLSTQTYVIASPKTFAQSIDVIHIDTEYLSTWQKLQKQMRNKLNSSRDESAFFEAKIIQKIQELLPNSSRLVVANSMPIREVDFFLEARQQDIKVMCNRGANGIDGVVSTALGVSTANLPTVLLTGDLSLFHDMNGLLLGRTHNLNLTIVLLNNNGGGIFRYLPQSTQKNFEYLFLTPHNINFEGTAIAYGLTYYKTLDEHSFEAAFTNSIDSQGIHLIEVPLDSAISKTLHDKYTNIG